MVYPCSRQMLFNEIGEHKFITYELDYPTKKEDFLKYIIPVLKEEYGLDIKLEEKIRNLSLDRKKNIEKFMAKYNTPDPSNPAPRGKPWLKNTRGKLPEILARDILKKLEKVEFACRMSLEEEDPDMPKRGIDNFGFIFKKLDGKISLDYIVSCEVKASDDKESPPSVVHKSSDSMFTSLKSITLLDQRFRKAIASIIDKLSAGEYLELICSVADDLEKGENLDYIRKKIIAVPFLLRKKECWTEDDFGKFATNYNEIECAAIRYYILTINYELGSFADEIYDELRKG